MIEPSSTRVAGDIFTLKSHEIGEYWPTILRFLLMIEDPDWIPDQIYQYLTDGRAQFWGFADGKEIIGILITRIDESALARFGVVWIVAGNGLELGLPKFFTHIEPWFIEKGCEYIEATGRLGWKKILPDFSFRSITLRKVLNHGRIEPEQHH